MECKLCDIITVIFPDFNSSGQFKIVKTEWDVLADRYNSMELGDLSISLSEALGISNESNSSAYTIIETDIKTSNAISVAASSYATATVDVSKSGYTPLGILQINKSGSASGYCVPSDWSISGNTASVFLRNTSTSAATVTVSLTILYRKD